MANTKPAAKSTTATKPAAKTAPVREEGKARVITAGVFFGNLTGAPKKVGDGLIARIMIGGIGADVAISEKMADSLKEDGYTKTRLAVLGELSAQEVTVDGKKYTNYVVRGSVRYAESDYFFVVANGGLISDVKAQEKDGKEFATGAIVATVGKNGDEDVKVLVSAIGRFQKAAEYATKGRRVRFSGPGRVETTDNGVRVSLQGAALGLGQQKKDDAPGTDGIEVSEGGEPDFS